MVSPLLYIPEYIFGVRVYIDVFHDIIFSYCLTANVTLTFGYIKWTPDVAFTGSFLDIVFGHYLRKEMGKKLPLKMRNESIIASFCSAKSPKASCLLSEKLEAVV